METLKYSLLKSPLKNAPDSWLAKPILESSCTFDDIVNNMLKRGTSLTQTDIMAVIDLFFTECETQIANGRPLNLPFFNGMPVVGGTFNGPDDTFDPSRHVIRYKLSPGKRLRKTIGQIKPEKLAFYEQVPVLSQFLDVNSQSFNSVITSKGIGELSGSKLQIDTTDPLQGIYFIHSNGLETQVTVVAQNHPTKLIFQIPELIDGAYRVEVRIKLLNSGVLRILQLNKTLTTGNNIQASDLQHK
ncbi:MAG: DUF4469 domain-containing protein [Prolixibacteraceae bacterium]|nr:DUF4469 domain-containing protein [Prolixibacteraceae bacterium]